METTCRYCSLEKALKYQNENVINRFTKLYELSFEEANDIFYETKKWLWLIAQPDLPKMWIIYPLKIIDEMWHNFILFTDDYTRYCLDYFGHYIHHSPTTKSEKIAVQKELQEDFSDITKKQIERVYQQCMSIYNQLGLDTLFKWYIEYPEQYGTDFFKHRRKDDFLVRKPTPELLTLVRQVKAGRIAITKTKYWTLNK